MKNLKIAALGAFLAVLALFSTGCLATLVVQDDLGRHCGPAVMINDPGYLYRWGYNFYGYRIRRPVYRADVTYYRVHRHPRLRYRQW